MKSEKQNTLAPFLVVSNCADALEFYCSALGAEELVRHNLPDGRITAKIAINGSEVWVGDEEPEFNNLSPKTIGGTGVRIILTDYDPDTIFTKAVAKGATQICPLTTEEFWRIGKLADPFGHVWEIGHPLK